MFKKIATIFKKDVANSSRDLMFLYMMFSPIALTAVFSYFVPAVESTELEFALHANTGQEFIGYAQNYGRVSVYENTEDLNERVLRSDDVPGFVFENNQYRLVLEGNEDPQVVRQSQSVIKSFLAGGVRSQFEVENLENRGLFREFVTILLIVMALSVGGYFIGLTLVEEKEEKSIKAIAVSPIRMSEYAAARSIMGVVVSFTQSFAIVIIMMGASAPYLQVLAATIASLGFTVALGYAIGSFSDNQYTAMLVLKLLGTLVFLIPVAAIFTPENLQFLYYVFPNYWIYRLFKNIFIDLSPQAFPPLLLLTLAMSLASILLCAPFAKKKLERSTTA